MATKPPSLPKKPASGCLTATYAAIVCFLVMMILGHFAQKQADREKQQHLAEIHAELDHLTSQGEWEKAHNLALANAELQDPTIDEHFRQAREKIAPILAERQRKAEALAAQRKQQAIEKAAAIKAQRHAAIAEAIAALPAKDSPTREDALRHILTLPGYTTYPPTQIQAEIDQLTTARLIATLTPQKPQLRDPAQLAELRRLAPENKAAIAIFAQQTHLEHIAAQFNAQGHHHFLSAVILTAAHDPDSVEIVSTTHKDEGKTLLVTCNFRAKNPLNATVISHVQARFNSESGELIKIISEGLGAK